MALEKDFANSSHRIPAMGNNAFEKQFLFFQVNNEEPVFP